MSHDDGLMEGAGARQFKFEKIGDTVEGVVEAVQKQQQTDPENGQPVTWPNGDPKFQFVFTLATSLDPADADDDGRRRIFAKYKLLQAIQDAVRLAKHSGSVVGGTLKVQHHATEPPKLKHHSPTKLYRAKFTPGAATAEEWGNDPGSDGAGSSAGNASSDADIPF
jgi:hypothetical protein